MFSTLIDIANKNSGFINILIFIITILLGWVSGIFKALRRRPKFKLQLLPGPTMCSTFPTGKKHNGYDVHKTAMSLYLKVSNIGSAPSSIENVEVGYHWHLRSISWEWVKYRLFWYWLKNPIITMEDFKYDLGEYIKVYPSLLQGTYLTGKTVNNYLKIGRSVNGVVYFEQPDSWEGVFHLPLMER
jgi:hypothetical protein